jgi:hypothetical protein
MFARSCHSSRLLKGCGNPPFLEGLPSKRLRHPLSPRRLPSRSIEGRAARFPDQATDGFGDCLVATMDRSRPQGASLDLIRVQTLPRSFQHAPKSGKHRGSSRTMVEWSEQIPDHIQMRHAASAQCTLTAAAAGTVHCIAAGHHRPKPVRLSRVVTQVGSSGTAVTASVPRSESNVSWETIGAD